MLVLLAVGAVGGGALIETIFESDIRSPDPTAAWLNLQPKRNFLRMVRIPRGLPNPKGPWRTLRKAPLRAFTTQRCTDKVGRSETGDDDRHAKKTE